MARALVAAGLAGGGAGFEHRSGQVCVVAGMPRKDPAHGVTDVGAVEIRADALREFGDHVFAQACVGAGGARLGALDACLDALAQFVAIDSAQVLGIGVEHLRCDGHGGLLLVPGASSCAPRGLAGPRPLPGQGPSMARIRLAPPRPGLHTTSRPGAELLPHAWLTTDHRRQVSTFHVGGQRRSTVFTGIGWDSWVRGATAASETAAEAVLEHVLRNHPRHHRPGSIEGSPGMTARELFSEERSAEVVTAS